MGLIERLKEKGVAHPVVMETRGVLDYPDIYMKRREGDQLSGLEPEFCQKDGLIAFLSPWKHLIGMAIPYGLLPKNRRPQAGEISSVSIMAWEWDYHQKIKELIEDALGQGYHYQLHVDQGPLPERHIAIGMGIAKAGRSQMLIHPEYGSAFYLAFLLTNLENEERDYALKPFMSPDFELSSKCETCRQCQLHCPTKALSGEADFDGRRCISAISQKKGLLKDWEMRALGRQLYGCDLCQLSCPTNSPLVDSSSNILPDRMTVNRINPLEILNGTQKTFVNDFGKMGFSWRGLGVSKRNALINLGNYGSLIHLEVLEQFKAVYEGNHNEVLAKTAQWAIRQIKERHHRKGTTHERLKSIIGD